MAEHNDFTTAEGLFKKRYEDKLVRTVPAFALAQKEIKFNPRKRQGDEYVIPLALQLEAGVTWAQQADGAFDLEVPIAGVTKQAKIQGSCHVIRSAIAYVAAFSGEDTEQAFDNTTQSTVKNAYEAIRRFLEADVLYGQDDEGIGVIEAIPGGGIPANSVKITLASWATGLWVVGAKVQIFDAGHTVIRNAAAPSITAVDYDTRIVTFDAIPAAAAPADVVHYKTQHTADGGGGAWKTMAGLKKIITNSGTLYGITTANYPQWRGNVKSCGSGPFSFPLLGRGMAKVIAKGGQGNRFVCWTSPESWTDLNSDIDAMRADDSSGYASRKFEMGHETLTYHSVAGPVDIFAHPMVKLSESFVIPKGGYERVGSTDITFDRAKMTGLSGGQGSFLRELTDKAGFEFRGFDHQAVLTEMPGFSVFFNDIVPNPI